MPRRGSADESGTSLGARYVDPLTAAPGQPIGRRVPIEQLDPNPNQPRQRMGDLSELMASISTRGIIEPLIVRQRGERYQIIAGERRYQAAVQVGITEVPVVIRDGDDGEVIEIALIENLQRKDLTPFEESEALHALAERFRYTHEELSRRLGKSRSAVTEAISLHALPERVKQLCRLADITAKSVLLQVARQGDEDRMIALVERITRGGSVTREAVRRSAAAGKAKSGRRRGAFVYRYAAPNKSFNLRLTFRRSEVPREQLIETLEGILERLRAEPAPDRDGSPVPISGPDGDSAPPEGRES
ncbi:MAG: ParB/RepB/Spo0J family partition protein [Acidobacteria bacterium]|nr:ParB/RepB/Spo0J family partition protein [Acidobacteriota bacterium]